MSYINLTLWVVTFTIYNLNHHIFQGYEFEKLNHTDCSSHFNKYDTYDNATEACKKDKLCKGIRYDDCNNEDQISLCMKDSELLPNPEINACVHVKFTIGRSKISKLFNHRVKFICIFLIVFTLILSRTLLIKSRSM